MWCRRRSAAQGVDGQPQACRRPHRGRIWLERTRGCHVAVGGRRCIAGATGTGTAAAATTVLGAGSDQGAGQVVQHGVVARPDAGGRHTATCRDSGGSPTTSAVGTPGAIQSRVEARSHHTASPACTRTHTHTRARAAVCMPVWCAALHQWVDASVHGGVGSHATGSGWHAAGRSARRHGGSCCRDGRGGSRCSGHGAVCGAVLVLGCQPLQRQPVHAPP